MKLELNFGRAAILTLTLGAIGMGGAVSGCGKVGPLEQPAPLLGAQNKRDYYAEKEARAKAAAAMNGGNTQGSADQNDDNAPLTTRDIKDPDQEMTTPRNSPVPGAPNPLGPTVSTTPYAK